MWFSQSVLIYKEGCYLGVTCVLPGCYLGVTRVLPGCYLSVTWFKIYLRSNDNDKGGCYNCSKKHMVREYTSIEVRFVVISSCKNKIKNETHFKDKIKNWNYFKENKSPSSNATIWVLKVHTPATTREVDKNEGAWISMISI